MSPGIKWIPSLFRCPWPSTDFDAKAIKDVGRPASKRPQCSVFHPGIGPARVQQAETFHSTTRTACLTSVSIKRFAGFLQKPWKAFISTAAGADRRTSPVNQLTYRFAAAAEGNLVSRRAESASGCAACTFISPPRSNAFTLAMLWQHARGLHGHGPSHAMHRVHSTNDPGNIE